MTDNHENHKDGLSHDLQIMGQAMLARRRALTMLGASAGSLLLVGGLGKILTPEQAMAGGTCTADPAETAGPYPADGTNQAQGETSDVLTESGVVRKDIRYSFLNTTTKARGVQVKLKLKIEDSRGCTPLSGYAIYVWHCDRDGHYSLYTVPSESYLRGVQVSDDKGRVAFTTIFPACYSGRWPHIHIEVFSSLDEATNGRNAVLTTQLAMPADVCTDVYNNAKGYQASVSNFANVSLDTDMVFGDDTAAQIAAMTPKMKGSWQDGYSASARVSLPI